jgi:hypothetical protein
MRPRSASRSAVILSAAAIAGTVSSFPALAEEVLRTFAPPSPPLSWTVSSAGGPTLKTVLTVDEPGIRGPRYAIAGEVRHRDVHGSGYLEMWSVLPQGQFFTRTLAPEGPMKALSGSSDWRPFLLPFFNKEGAPPPRQLVVNVALPGAGSVELRKLRLLQFAEGEDPLAPKGAWWSPRTGGLVGGTFGALLGCFGALVGWLSSRGRARAFVLAALGTVGAMSLLALAAGFAAWSASQPYAVYYPLLLLGVLGTVIPLGLRPFLKRRYQDLELRRMQAMDLR